MSEPKNRSTLIKTQKERDVPNKLFSKLKTTIHKLKVIRNAN